MARVIDSTLSSDVRHDRELKEAFYRGVKVVLMAIKEGLSMGLTTEQIIASIERSMEQSKRREL